MTGWSQVPLMGDSEPSPYSHGFWNAGMQLGAREDYLERKA